MKSFVSVLIALSIVLFSAPSHTHDYSNEAEEETFYNCKIENVMLAASGATAIVAPFSLGFVAVLTASSASSLAIEQNQPLHYIAPILIGGLAVMSIPITLVTLGFVVDKSQVCIEQQTKNIAQSIGIMALIFFI